jgi:hypothetical protein
MFEIERKTLRGGKTVYRAAVGILSLLLFTQARPNGGSRRISPVAECPDQGPLTEPAADAPPRGWGLLFMPLKRPCRRDRGTPRSHGFGSFPVRVAAGASAREAAVRTGRTANGSADLGFPGMKFCPVYR